MAASGVIPFFELTEQNRRLRGELDAVWRQTVSSAHFILATPLEHFEKNFAKFTGSSYAIGVSTGLDALALSLRAAGVGPGHEAILPANTFIATALAVSQTGARPVLVDVDPDTMLIDPRLAAKAVTKRTRAILPVHLYGQPVAMEPILRLARENKLAVVEDAAQAHGASWKGRPCGSFGDAGCFSFYPSKNLGAFGDGGLVTTSSKELERRIRLMRNYGSLVKYQHETIGYNQRLDALQAAILDVKLRHLKAWNAQRRALAARYDRQLRSVPGVRVLPKRAGAINVYHLYVIRSRRRDQLKEFLEERGIHCAVHYPIPIHLQGAYKGLGYSKGDFPVTEKAAGELLSLPMYPEMRPADADRVARTVRAFFDKKGG